MGSAAWADDIAIPIATEDASALRKEIERIVQHVHSVFANKGFVLNLLKAKTSVVATFKGPGAAEMRKQSQLGSNSRLSVHLGQHEAFVHFVPHYKHLGTIFRSFKSSAHLLKPNFFSGESPTARQMTRLQTALVYMLKRVLRLLPGECTTHTLSDAFPRANVSMPRARLALDRQTPLRPETLAAWPRNVAAYVAQGRGHQRGLLVAGFEAGSGAACNA